MPKYRASYTVREEMSRFSCSDNLDFLSLLPQFVYLKERFCFSLLMNVLHALKAASCDSYCQYVHNYTQNLCWVQSAKSPCLPQNYRKLK